MSLPLAGRRAVVTGGTRGIGFAIAERLIAEGAEVTATGTAREGKGPDGCSYHELDLADSEVTEAFAAELQMMNPDVLVNNAGINVISEFERIDLSDFDRIQQVNLRGPFLLCRAVIPLMRQQGWGRIVNISSIFGKVSRAQRAAYSASKFAIDGMTAALAAEVAADGVLVNCVSPGFIATDMTREILGEDGMARLESEIPAARLGRPDEVAALVSWLAGPENTYVSGQNIAIDGGFTRV